MSLLAKPRVGRTIAGAVKWIKFVFAHTLCSVIFGIMLMVLIGAYIAVGSGVPQVREYFEMNELQFFAAWPLKLLMGLLCVTLATVTWRRIPFTPPRYGVWTIHAGIITLVVGTSVYYHLKIEGRTVVYKNQTARYFYDNNERCIYLRGGGDPFLIGVHPLPSLPRFGAYDQSRQAAILNQPDLQDITNMQWKAVGEEGESAPRSISDLAGVSETVRLAVVGYYPYARIVHQVEDDPGNTKTMLSVKLSSKQGVLQERLLPGDGPIDQRTIMPMTGMEVGHLATDEQTAQAIVAVAGHIHRMDVEVAGKTQTIWAQVGNSYPIADTGYTITVEGYEPSWEMFGTHERVRALRLMVKSQSPAPSNQFRRMVLDGKDVQTDFKLDPSAPFMGIRQKDGPIDKNLIVHYHYENPIVALHSSGLLSELLPAPSDSDADPQTEVVKYLFITSGDHGLAMVESTSNEIRSIEQAEDGGELNFDSPDGDLTLAVARRQGVREEPKVEEIPPQRRDRDTETSGAMEVVRVQLSVGQWSQETLVGFGEAPMPERDVASGQFTNVDWAGEPIYLPGATSPLYLQLGHTPLPLPADLTLKDFQLVPYPGREEKMFRDYQSTLRVGDSSEDQVAKMNNPIYFADGDWIFFQASYDPDLKYSVIGVGTRPGVKIMIMGCLMIVTGLLYAFYVKPFVIRAMKRRALADAANAKSSRTPRRAMTVGG